MRQETVKLLAGQAASLPCSESNVFFVLGIGAASLVSLSLSGAGQDVANMDTEVRRGLKVKLAQTFNQITLKADANCTFTYVTSLGDLDINLYDGLNANVTIQNIDANPVPIKVVGFSSDGGAVAAWWNSTASLVSLIRLGIAAAVGAGSHVYSYTSGNLTTDAWTINGTTRTKTYTYTSGVLTAESDWV